MARYEAVVQDDDDASDSASIASPRHAQSHTIPSSPPPSFYSREELPNSRSQPVDSSLTDAFVSDDDDDDDATDDVRHRLVRQPVAVAELERQATPSHLGQQQVELRSQTPLRVYGSGIQSDGVFSNLSARTEGGVNTPEKEEQPPTYEQAAADAAPPYWETTILAPGLGALDEVYLDGLPVGSLFSFVWNALISMSFQLVGFLLTYLLHSTHAAKNGSRAGLGVNLIQYGFYLKGSGTDSLSPAESDKFASPTDPSSHDFDPSDVPTSASGGGILTSDWISYLLMIIGWFILIRAISDYMQARRHEMLVLQSPDRNFGVTAVIAEGEQPVTVV